MNTFCNPVTSLYNREVVWPQIGSGGSRKGLHIDLRKVSAEYDSFDHRMHINIFLT